MTAAAYRYFGDVAVDAAVIEVGLGGRYDATNVADGAVAVVTNVELDHVEILGDTGRKIAEEKSGIIKPGSDCGDRRRRRGRSCRSSPSRPAMSEPMACGGAGSSSTAPRTPSRTAAVLISVRTPAAEYEDLFLPLYGAHQGENASAALAAAEAFFGAPLDQDVVDETFAHARSRGVWRSSVAGRSSSSTARTTRPPGGRPRRGARGGLRVVESVVLVFGCLNGRDPAELLGAIGTDRLVHVVACAPPSLRAVPAEAVADAARRLGLEASTAESVGEALDLARSIARTDDLVLVTGSLYLVGAAREQLCGVGCSPPWTGPSSSASPTP